jgi:uncharacterized damage-inducible protein DinB
MNSEIASYVGQLRSVLDRLCRALQELDEGQLNWRPPVTGANSAYVIATHTLGNARAWILGIACGQPLERDRPAEFRASGRDASVLVAEARRLSDEIDAALSALSPSDLDRRLVPPKSLWGEGEPLAISVRQAILHVVEHASLHLGELLLTRDLAIGQQ